MSHAIRTHQPGDAELQARLYNLTAANLPNVRPVTAADIRRDCRAPRHFDPELFWVAEVAGEPVGYCQAHPGGLLGVPWALPGRESAAGDLLRTALGALSGRGLTRATVALSAKWAGPRALLEAAGFAHARDYVNYRLSFDDLPTLMGVSGGRVFRILRPDDLPSVEKFHPGLLRLAGPALERHLFANPRFAAESLFALTGRQSAGVLAAGSLILERGAPRAADKSLDPDAPAFRLGAFGTEGWPATTVDGMFSCLFSEARDPTTLGLDLLAHVVDVLDDDDGPEVLAAQVPSDQPALMRFYGHYFRRQGAFPVLECPLEP